MSVKLTGIELFCVDHVKLSQWYERALGLKPERTSRDVVFMTDGTTQIVFCEGRPGSYKNSTLYFMTDDYESIDKAICDNDGIRVQRLAVVEEDELKTRYSALYEDIEKNVIVIFVERPKSAHD